VVALADIPRAGSTYSDSAIIFRELGKSDAEPASMTARAPQEINVYASDPNLEIRATLVIFWNARDPFEILYLATQPTGKQPSRGDILVTSNTPDVALNAPDVGTDLEPPRVSMDNRLEFIDVRSGYDVQVPPVESLFAEEVQLFYTNELDAKGKYGVPVAAFRVSSFKAPIVHTGGTYYARLPLLDAAQESLVADQPQFMAEFVPPYDHGKLDADLVQLPVLKNEVENKRLKAGILGTPDVTPSDYESLLNEPAAVYWAPRSVVTTEVLKDVTPELDNANDSIAPSGNYSGDDYIWQNTGPLEPTIVAAQVDSVNSKSDFLFLSGIFFATAAAALLAFLQELPISRPPWLRRRK